MGSEVEVKLEVPPARLRGMAQASWLSRLAGKTPRQEKLVSVYFDTPKRALRDAGLSLRVRQTGNTHTQTVKSSGSSAVDRGEWEWQVPGAQPVRKLVQHTALKPFADKKHWRALKPVFETRVTRTIYPVRSGGSRFEIALDRGRIRSRHRFEAIHEVEIELVDGAIEDVPRLARKFAAKVPTAFGLTSKAERGYALADETQGDHHKAQPVRLSADFDTAQGFRAIAMNCLAHVARNRDAVLAGDAEGVHQMRVGLRRLRTAISLFQDLVEDPESAKIKKGLKWTTAQLRGARDFDVFLEEAQAEVRDETERTGLGSMTADLKARREEGFERAAHMARGAQYRSIILETGLWILGGGWATQDDALLAAKRRRGIADTARDILSARTRKVRKKLRHFDRLDDRGRHKLRIAVKKLRYACTFFEDLFGQDSKSCDFGKALKALQGALGRLNDIRVHKSYARKAVASRRAPATRRSYGLGVVTGRESGTAERCLKSARKAGKQFRKLKSYW